MFRSIDRKDRSGHLMSNLRCHGAGFLTPGTDAGIMQTWMGSTSASCACRRAVDHTVRGCSPRGGGPTCSHGCCRERNDSFRWTKRASDYRSRQPGGACQWRPRPRSRACAGGRARETALLACERDAVAWIASFSYMACISLCRGRSAHA